jgi:hypothetical protein
MSFKPKEYISRGFLWDAMLLQSHFDYEGPIKEQDFTFPLDCLVNTAFFLVNGGGAVAALTATAKFCWQVCFHFTNFYLEASGFLKKKMTSHGLYICHDFQEILFLFYLFFDFG